MTQDNIKIPDWELKRRSKISRTMKGRKTWNYGKTIKDDPRIEKLRVWQGKEFSETHKRKIGLKSTGRKHTEETKKKISQTHKGKLNPNWKGGLYTRIDGYKFLSVPDHPKNVKGYVAQHRVIIEKKLGIILDKDQIVHHKDGNKGNNDPNNLVVMDKIEHIKLHRSLKSS